MHHLTWNGQICISNTGRISSGQTHPIVQQSINQSVVYFVLQLKGVGHASPILFIPPTDVHTI